MNLIVWIILGLISFSATPLLERENRSYLVVWNIGQGQWVTAINDSTCFHFDTGGEFFPWKKLKKYCGDQKNQISLSHWDNDHINGLKSWPHNWNTCLAIRPLGRSSQKKAQLLSRFSDCQPGAD
ncbi:MAG: hydrolase, partial [Bacillota bacterium]